MYVYRAQRNSGRLPHCLEPHCALHDSVFLAIDYWCWVAFGITVAAVLSVILYSCCNGSYLTCLASTPSTCQVTSKVYITYFATSVLFEFQAGCTGSQGPPQTGESSYAATVLSTRCYHKSLYSLVQAGSYDTESAVGVQHMDGSLPAASSSGGQSALPNEVLTLLQQIAAQNLENGNIASANEEARARWRRHFAQLEAGEESSLQQLYDAHIDGYEAVDPAFADVPAILEFEHQLYGVLNAEIYGLRFSTGRTTTWIFGELPLPPGRKGSPMAA